MGNLIKWKSIDPEATYDKARVYRSATETGSYAIIASQPIGDQSYYDEQGTTSTWYKVDFYDTVSAAASSLSDPIKGGTYNAYCTPDEVRQVTNITPSDLTDTQLANLISFAGAQMNADMNIYREKESIYYINESKTNDIDGTNKVYYTKFYPLGDSNNDFKITVADITVYNVDNTGAETELPVLSVNAATGRFELVTAVTAENTLSVTYNTVQRRVDTPDRLVKVGCIMLTAAWAYSKINIGKAPRFHMGTLTVFRDMNSFHEYYKKYVAILTDINDRRVAGIMDTPNIM